MEAIRAARLKESANEKNMRNREYVDKLSAKLIRYYSDPDKKGRLAKGLCKSCSYIFTDKIGGQAFTHKNCDACDVEMIFPNTCTNSFCLECAIELKYCRHCGQKMD